MFWVTTSRSSPSALPPAGPARRCAGLGSTRGERRPARVVEAVHDVGLARRPPGVATSSTRCPSHSPSASRNVGTPLSAEMPAPVRTTTPHEVTVRRRAAGPRRVRAAGHPLILKFTIRPSTWVTMTCSGALGAVQGERAGDPGAHLTAQVLGADQVVGGRPLTGEQVGHRPPRWRPVSTGTALKPMSAAVESRHGELDRHGVGADGDLTALLLALRTDQVAVAHRGDLLVRGVAAGHRPSRSACASVGTRSNPTSGPLHAGRRDQDGYVVVAERHAAVLGGAHLGRQVTLAVASTVARSCGVSSAATSPRGPPATPRTRRCSPRPSRR